MLYTIKSKNAFVSIIDKYSTKLSTSSIAAKTCVFKYFAMGMAYYL
ncbi:MAG: hypothetical protein U5K55_06330 [Aliarcobacter sp.]|nr:hypothetical protein [Aliarcobacter sp.]